MKLGEWLMKRLGIDRFEPTDNATSEPDRRREEATLREWRRRAEATRLRASLQRDRE